MICEPCNKRGWVLNERKEPVHCPLCGGRTELSWYALAKKLGEQPTTLARVRQMRSKQKTCLRVFEKVTRLLWPKGQQVMFR